MFLHVDMQLFQHFLADILSQMRNQEGTFIGKFTTNDTKQMLVEKPLQNKFPRKTKSLKVIFENLLSWSLSVLTKWFMGFLGGENRIIDRSALKSQKSHCNASHYLTSGL